jgi:hypothetical protein
VDQGSVAHLIARGGRRWRSLSVARHELEVANLLNHAPELADRLRLVAHGRLERYLAPPQTERHAAVISGALAAVAALVALRVGVGVVGEDASRWPMQLLVGAVGALVWHVVHWRAKPVLRRVLDRRDAHSQPSSRQTDIDRTAM